jgi:glycosyltransferase involved in cell wall biosynthesis
MPCISIVLPVFNAQPFLDACMQKLTSQDYKDFEIIAINDGSLDDSLAILRKWSAKDARCRVIDQANSGPGPTRNVGLDAATGDYVIFLDPDDVYHRSYLLTLHKKAMQTNADVVICASSLCDHQTGKVTIENWTLRKDLLPKSAVFSGQDVGGNIFRITIGWPWDKLFKTSFLKKHHLRYPDLRNSEDGAFVYPALCFAERIAVVKNPLIQHVMNRDGSLSNSRKDFALCFFDALRAVRGRLKAHELYDLFEKGFLGWVLDFSLWNLETAHPDDQEKIYTFLKTTGFEEMGVFSKPRDYYAVEHDYRRAEALMSYRFPECLIIAKLEGDLMNLENSKAYRFGSMLARPRRIATGILRRQKAKLL